MNPIRLGAMALLGWVAGSESYAADVHSGRPAELVIEGEIQPGDCLKVRNSLAKEGLNELYLASPGGSLREAMEIGRLIRALRLETIVPGRNSVTGRCSSIPDHCSIGGATWLTPDCLNARLAAQSKLVDRAHNYMCASACFFVFVAGISRTSDIGDPILGIHRPYLLEGDLQKLGGDEAISSARDAKTGVEAYLKEMGVPSKYSDQMFSIPPDAMQWIGPEDFDRDLRGVIPELKDWVAAKGKADLAEAVAEEEALSSIPTAPFADRNKKFFADEREELSNPVLREMYVLDGLATDAWRRMFFSPDSPETMQSFCTVTR